MSAPRSKPTFRPVHILAAEAVERVHANWAGAALKSYALRPPSHRFSRPEATNSKSISYL